MSFYAYRHGGRVFYLYGTQQPSPSWMAWPYLTDLLPDEDKNVGVGDSLKNTGGGIFHRDLVP